MESRKRPSSTDLLQSPKVKFPLMPHPIYKRRRIGLDPNTDVPNPEIPTKDYFRSKARKALMIAEILETVLVHVDSQSLVRAQGVNSFWRANIEGSRKLKQKLFLEPATIKEAFELNMVGEQDLVQVINGEVIRVFNTHVFRAIDVQRVSQYVALIIRLSDMPPQPPGCIPSWLLMHMSQGRTDLQPKLGMSVLLHNRSETMEGARLQLLVIDQPDAILIRDLVGWRLDFSATQLASVELHNSNVHLEWDKGHIMPYWKLQRARITLEELAKKRQNEDEARKKLEASKETPDGGEEDQTAGEDVTEDEDDGEDQPNDEDDDEDDDEEGEGEDDVGETDDSELDESASGFSRALKFLFG